MGSLLERLAAKTQEAEVYEARSDTIEVSFANGAVKGALARESSGVAVRAIRDGRLGFASSTDRTPAAEAKLVENLLGSIAVGDPAGFRFPGRTAAGASAAGLAVWDERTARLGPRELVALGARAIAAVKERHPDVALDVSVRRSISEVRLEGSRGARTEERGTAFSLSIEFNRTRDEDVLLDDDGVASVASSEAAVDAAAARVIEKLDRARRDARLPRSGDLPVLFSASGASVLWGPLFAGLSGKAVQTGTSPLRTKLGERILDPRIDLADDGTAPGLLGSSLWDDEGTPRRRTRLVADGVLASFVHDLRTASALGHAPTGNGERPGVLGAPGPGFSNLVFRGGTRSEAELLRSIDTGLLVESVIGMGQGNVLSGSFSNTVGLAYLVEGGEIVGRLRDVSIAGNVYEILRDRLGDLGRELDESSGSMRRPAVLVSSLSVVGK